ncbi:hypothetical protein C444_19257 [Haloarcula japonica DSM 6131]|uniref:Uncharacterized protein n=1 Tax=Haloarcula japonica (strain ATCC 49778 / DSM 6131 / JCM 7785 / NBRC 101032 / NCIMB 13157 / TR-1) TaxID=1227453 RepID=M0L5E8_HALJT|nr:hypothetical protein C444_19257 [Haloarcula japonica DSM 6131]
MGAVRTDRDPGRSRNRADRRRFLVYDIDTQFEWQSVLLAGDISSVPKDRACPKNIA